MLEQRVQHNGLVPVNGLFQSRQERINAPGEIVVQSKAGRDKSQVVQNGADHDLIHLQQ
jgi:hypothetical protein